MKKDRAVALLSGGLDSMVSLAVALKSFDVRLVLFFNYGQRSVKKEFNAVNNICDYYNLSYKEILLDWIKEITTTSLINMDEKLPAYTIDKLSSDIVVLQDSARAVWIPNRNGVMLNIGASFAESLDCKYLVFGANSEEAVTFPDNSLEYTNVLSKAFSYSTSNAVEIYAPLANKTKTDIVEIALKFNLPLGLLWSCYSQESSHCGVCESCARLKRAFINNNRLDLWREISSL